MYAYINESVISVFPLMLKLIRHSTALFASHRPPQIKSCPFRGFSLYPTISERTEQKQNLTSLQNSDYFNF